MTALLPPMLAFQPLVAGVPLPGGKVWFYQAGTSTPQAAYTDATGTVACANPLILDANGQGVFWLQSGLTYKINVLDANNVQQAGWPRDNIPADLAAGILAALAGTGGAALLGDIFPATGAVPQTQAEINAQIVDVRKFGAIADGLTTKTDNTAAIQAAINYAISIAGHLYIHGYYSVSHLVINNASGLVIHGDGSLIGLASGSYESVLTIKNSASICFMGQLGVNANWNTGYTAAIAIYADAGTCSQIQTYGLQPGCAAIGWMVGSSAYPNALVSEINIFGAQHYGCLTSVKALGVQTLVNFNGCELLTDTNGWAAHGTAGWASLPNIGIWSVGAVVNVIGGEVNMTGITSGAVVLIQPLNGAAGNTYGSVTLANAGLESASQYGLMNNPNSLTPIVAGSGLLSLAGCLGYVGGDAFAMITASADYTGRIVARNNNFYGAVARSNSNIACLGSGANVYCDDVSFSTNFKQGLQGTTGGIQHFDYRLVFQAANCNSQALTGGGAANTLKWTTSLSANDTVPFNAAYSSATGIFTVTSGGLKSVNVAVDGFKTSGPTQVLDLNLYIGGVLWGSAPTMMGGAGNGGRIAGSWDVGDLAAGTTIYVQAAQTGGATTATGGVSERITIRARN